MTKTKIPAIATRVPQSRGEAATALKRIGELNRQVGRLEADLNDRLAALKEAAEAEAAPLRAQAKADLTGLQTWCEANRESILDNRTKTADLGTGKVSWRLRPPSVTVRRIDDVIAAIKAMGLQRFLRVKEDVNKEALREEPELARTIAGVSIGSAGEEFIAEPFETELAGAA